MRPMKMISAGALHEMTKVGGKRVHYKTLNKLVAEANLKPDFVSPQGTRFYKPEKAHRFLSRLPTVRGPRKTGFHLLTKGGSK
jgi:hypothetical protein